MSEHFPALDPPGKVFDDAWQAQTLAIADAMVQAGHFSASAWSETLGAELRAAQSAGRPDTLETYYLAALAALERLCAANTAISADEQARRKADWRKAYVNTPHGQPVTLSAAGKDRQTDQGTAR